MRKRLAPPGRMCAGARSRSSHISYRCSARPCSYSTMFAQAAKKGHARSMAHIYRRAPNGMGAWQQALGAPCKSPPTAMWRCNSV